MQGAAPPAVFNLRRSRPRYFLGICEMTAASRQTAPVLEKIDRSHVPAWDAAPTLQRRVSFGFDGRLLRLDMPWRGASSWPDFWKFGTLERPGLHSHAGAWERSETPCIARRMALVADLREMDEAGGGFARH